MAIFIVKLTEDIDIYLILFRYGDAIYLTITPAQTIYDGIYIIVRSKVYFIY